MSHRARICIATGTRADWGLLSPLADSLRRDPDIDLRILATNMHLMERYGHTVDEIISDGFEIDAAVTMPDDSDDSEQSRANAMGICLQGTAEALGRMKPDAIVVLGDRYEMLAVASAAAVMRIPVVHIAGGEITLGAIDDSLRHAITKLASLHLTATEPYRRRIIQMGEDPARVINIGAPGVWNAFNRPLPTADEALATLGIAPATDFAIVTYHPATLDPVDPAIRIEALLEALGLFDSLHYIITYPNNDARSKAIIEAIERFAAENPSKITAIKSLGAARYLALSKTAKAVIGNSSSGIVEVPSAGTPTVDIGIRQLGRIAGPSVIHCGDSADDIAGAIASALSPEMQQLAAKRVNPYARENTIAEATAAIKDFVLNHRHELKQFHDLPCSDPSI